MKWRYVAPAQRYDLLDDAADVADFEAAIVAEITLDGDAQWYALVAGELLDDSSPRFVSAARACEAMKNRIPFTPDLP